MHTLVRCCRAHLATDNPHLVHMSSKQVLLAV